MPNEKIASAIVTDDHAYVRSLHVVWGEPGSTPYAPHGWVNDGFIEVQIREDHTTHGSCVGVGLDPEQINRMIRELKRARRRIG